MAERTAISGRQPAQSGDELSRPELSALLPLVRLLARRTARETWAASSPEGSQQHDQDDQDDGQYAR